MRTIKKAGGKKRPAKPKTKPKSKKIKSSPKPKPTPKKIVRHLERGSVTFELVPHRKVYTAFDLAQTSGSKLEEIAKTLLVRVQPMTGRAVHYVVVLPASCHLDLQKVKRVLKAERVELAPERAFRRIGLEPGSISPFGSLYGYGVLVDQGLVKTRQVLVSAESLVESVRLRIRDLVELEQALVGAVGKKNRLKPAKKKTAKKAKKGKPAPKRKVAKKVPASKASAARKKK